MDKIKNGPLREAGLRMLVIMVYSVIVALNFKSFVQAGDLFPGGFTGLTRLLQRCAQEYSMSIPVSYRARASRISDQEKPRRARAAVNFCSCFRSPVHPVSFFCRKSSMA